MEQLLIEEAVSKFTQASFCDSLNSSPRRQDESLYLSLFLVLGTADGYMPLRAGSCNRSPVW